MKYTHSIILIGLLAVMQTGCMFESKQNCPFSVSENNVKLHFSLLDNQGDEVFKDNIGKTDLLLFDNNGRYHSSHTIPTSSMGDDLDIVLTLEPGSYTVVSWGNLNGNMKITDIADISSIGDGYVICNSTDNGDPLYYAPDRSLLRSINPDKKLFSFTVPAKGQVNETIEFTHAHKKLDIYIKDYYVNGQLPVIEVKNDHRGYDFYMNHLNGEMINYRQQSQSKQTAEGVMANSTFYISRLRQDNAVDINIVNPVTGNLDYSVPLNDIIESFNDFDLEIEIAIPILFEFFEGSFSIKLPTWESKPTKPEL